MPIEKTNTTNNSHKHSYVRKVRGLGVVRERIIYIRTHIVTNCTFIQIFRNQGDNVTICAIIHYDWISFHLHRVKTKLILLLGKIPVEIQYIAVIWNSKLYCLQ